MPRADVSKAVGAARWVLRIAITGTAIAALVGLIWTSGWENLSQYFSRLGVIGLAQLLVLGVAECVLDAMALRASLPSSPPLSAVLGANQTGALVNRFVPLEAGEVVKGALMSRHVDWAQAVTGTVVWNYVAKLSKPLAATAALAVGWLLTLLAPASGSGATQAAESQRMALLLVLPVLASFAPYALFRFLLRHGALVRLAHLARVLGLMRKRPEEMARKAAELDTTIRQFYTHHPRGYTLVLLYQLASKVVSCVTLVWTMVLLDPESGVANGIMAWSGLQVMSYLVALFPTRLGTTEASGYALFAMVGLDPALGLASQIILTIKALILNLLLGLLALVPKATPATVLQSERPPRTV